MRYIFIIFFSSLIIWGFAQTTLAAVISLSSDFATLHVGDTVAIKVKVNTEHEILNAIESTVTFPNSLLQYISSDDSDSVLNMWIQKPTIIDGSKIHFAGVTPGGFVEADAPIVTLLFKVIGTGQANIELSETSLLKNDGAGTPAKTTQQSLHISVVDGASAITMQTVDTEIPEYFVPQIINDPDVFSGHATLIFSTTDKGSGIDHFEIKEGWLGQYKIATSPYEIINQSLDTPIYIKAVDRLGNARVEIFYPQNYRPWYQEQRILVTIVGLCVLGLFIFRKIFLRYWRRFF